MIVQGDCLEVLEDLPDGCVTAIVTDPPYGLEFMGKGWDKVLPPVDVWRECLRVLKPGGHALIFGGTRTYHRLACAVEDSGFEVRDCLMWLYGQGFPKSLDVSKAIDKAAGSKRGVVGSKVYGDGHVQNSSESIGFGGCDPLVDKRPVTAPATEDAKLWAGYGTALKPAWEPILLARKPLVGTVERNCREHGTGALNIDGCRIGTEERINGAASPSSASRKSRVVAGYRHDDGVGPGSPEKIVTGRWPANLVLDQEAAVQLDAQAGERGGWFKEDTTADGRATATGFQEGDGSRRLSYGDSGGASRFFYCAKASKADRGDGNTHPTVKPVELMRWLVRLVKGPGENLILDPFGGSGTTGVACLLEDVPFLLIEREAAYVAIAEARIAGG